MGKNKKTKVGVITFHRALNYGAVLQGYALQTFLTKQGFASELIDYLPTSFRNERRLLNFSSLSSLARTLYKYPRYKQKIRRFDRFLKKCNLSDSISQYKDLNVYSKKYDFLVSGSDQVWNRQWNHSDGAYYLDFADLSKKYSYAASLGKSDFDQFESKRLADLIKSFRRISIREKSGSDLISSLIGRNVETHVDPTLLLDKEDWGKITHVIDEKPYLLIYTLEEDTELLNKAFEISAKKKINIIQIKDVFKRTKGPIKFASCISPEHFVSLFSSASFIITNSFHGLVFSTIFEKDFIVSPQKRPGAPNDRFFDFINKFDLSSHLINEYKNQTFDYSKTRVLIAKEVERSSAYFESIKSDISHEFALSPSKCSGCTACMAVCPVNAIEMYDKEDGFYYPIIDDTKCIKCGLCEKVCPYYNQQTESPNNLIKTLAVKNRDETQRQKSRSGGVFPLLAKDVVERGGIVYGAIINNDTFDIVHMRAENPHDLPLFSESKYSESKLGNTFKKVIQDLKDGKEVLFSGTPCQNAGLHHFTRTLKIDDKKLTYIDLICHGYFAPEMFKNYISNLKKKHGQVSSFKFRDKEYGWSGHFESFQTEKGKAFDHSLADIFNSNSFLRSSCYECPFTHLHRYGDITLADGWGVENVLPDFDDNKGVSAILINTEKGLKVFDNIKKNCEAKELDVSTIMQINMYRPTNKPKDYDRIHAAYREKGFDEALSECSKRALKSNDKNRFKARIVKFLRKIKFK